MQQSTQRFSYEYEIVQLLLNNVNSIFPSKRPKLVINEFEIGSGVIDLAIVMLNNNRYEDRCSKAPYIISSEMELVILSLLDTKKGTSLDNITEIMGIGEKKANNCLKLLNDKKLLYKKGKSYFAFNYSKPIYSRFISIEAKLNKWNRALEQAFRNHLFSTESFIAIDLAQSNSAVSNIQEFIKNNVGLITVSDSSNQICKRVYSSVQRKPISPYFCQLASEKIFNNLITKGVKI